MKKSSHFPIYIIALAIFSLPVQSHAQSTRPAMIGNSADSVAAKLHYPPKAKASKKEAAIPFYCEVGGNGKPDQLQLYGARDKNEFRQGLLVALRGGRFQPAMAGGQD